MRAWILCLLIWGAAAPLQAQQLGFPARGSEILIIDQEQLFAQSRFGRRVILETEEASTALIAENRAIEAELVEEERSLTEERAELTPEAFRLRADAFDAKVQGIRQTQAEKSEALSSGLEAERRRFFQAIVPVLGEILRAQGATAILDKRSVLLSVNSADVTLAAIQQIDRILGDGVVVPAPEADLED